MKFQADELASILAMIRRSAAPYRGGTFAVRKQVVRLLDPAFDRTGLFKGERVSGLRRATAKKKPRLRGA